MIRRARRPAWRRCSTGRRARTGQRRFSPLPRCVRITRSQPASAGLNTAGLIEPAEKELAAALQEAEAKPRKPGSMDDFLNAFRPMVPAVSRFFNDVLVMAEDPAVRANRLALLQRIVALADGVADLSKMEGF